MMVLAPCSCGCACAPPHAPRVMSVFRDDILAGRTAFVTGGHSGIGYGIAEQLGRHGARVCVFGRRADVLAAAVDSLGGAWRAQPGQCTHHVPSSLRSLFMHAPPCTLDMLRTTNCTVHRARTAIQRGSLTVRFAEPCTVQPAAAGIDAMFVRGDVRSDESCEAAVAACVGDATQGECTA